MLDFKIIFYLDVGVGWVHAGYQRCIADSEVTVLSSLAHPSSVEGAELGKTKRVKISWNVHQLCLILFTSPSFASHRVFKNEWTHTMLILIKSLYSLLLIFVLSLLLLPLPHPLVWILVSFLSLSTSSRGRKAGNTDFNQVIVFLTRSFHEYLSKSRRNQ